jgi:hypothetical protein
MFQQLLVAIHFESALKARSFGILLWTLTAPTVMPYSTRAPRGAWSSKSKSSSGDTRPSGDGRCNPVNGNDTPGLRALYGGHAVSEVKCPEKKKEKQNMEISIFVSDPLQGKVQSYKVIQVTVCA